MTQEKKRHLRTVIGMVVSDQADKTVVVAVRTTFTHRLYDKVVRQTRKYMAHDEENACRVGDKVMLAETRPLSRRKRWRVAQIVEKAK